MAKKKIQYGDYAPKETLVEKPRPEPPSEPEPVKKETSEDLFIVADSGYLGEDSTGSSVVYRIRVSGKGGIVDKVGKTKIRWGYGFDRQESIRDFIRRNDSDVIERIFNVH